MARTLALLAVLGFAVAFAQADVVATYFCDQDNFNANYSGETTWNCGATSNWRFTKVMQEGTYYCDWSDADLADLKAALDAGTGDPGTWYEVQFAISGTSGASDSKVAHVETLDSITDWVEGGNNRNPLTTGQDGACNDYANFNGSIPWKSAVPGVSTNEDKLFWELPAALANSVDLLGWKNGPEAENLNTVVLDDAIVQLMVGTSGAGQYNRGLRFYQDNYDGTENAGCAAQGQWGGAGSSGGRLLLVEVPEPATMVLLAIGGVGVLLRKKR